jgi:hypothetical protein
MSRHSQRSAKTPTRTIVAAAFAVAGLAVTGAGVFAGLNATATGTQAVTSGTLSLTMGNETGSTFSGAVSGLAPGDVVNRYVTLTNGGTLDAQTLTLGVTGTGSLLSTSAAKGLTVTVSSCATSWSVSAGVATCASSGAVATVLAATPVATLAVTPGSIQSTFAPAAVLHLKIALTLPDQGETVTNGTFPGGTIQGLSDTLTYTFNELQRTATTTNS